MFKKCTFSRTDWNIQIRSVYFLFIKKICSLWKLGILGKLFLTIIFSFFNLKFSFFKKKVQKMHLFQSRLNISRLDPLFLRKRNKNVHSFFLCSFIFFIFIYFWQKFNNVHSRKKMFIKYFYLFFVRKKKFIRAKNMFILFFQTATYPSALTCN